MPQISDSRPVRVSVGGETYDLEPTITAADAVEEAHGGVLDAMRLAGKLNRQATAHILLACSGGKVTPSAIRKLSGELFALTVEQRGDVAAEVNRYLAWMMDGFAPAPTDKREPAQTGN